MLPPSWKSEVQKAVEEATAANEEKRITKERNAAADITAAIDALGEAQKTQTDHEDTNESKNRAISVATLGLVAATVLFTGLSWCTFRGQLIVAQSSDATLKETLIASNRPWIKADIEPGGIFYDVNGVNFTLRFNIKNIGHSPATNIMPHPEIMAPAIGVKPENGGDRSSFDPRGEMLKIVARQKTQPVNALGTSLFPEEIAVEDFTVTIGKDELKRITQVVPQFIAPTAVGTISYRMGFDSQVHQTGFVISIGRKSSRPDRADTAIFPDEGNIPAEKVVFTRSILEGGYAD